MLPRPQTSSTVCRVFYEPRWWLCMLRGYVIIVIGKKKKKIERKKQMGERKKREGKKKHWSQRESFPWPCRDSPHHVVALLLVAAHMASVYALWLRNNPNKEKKETKKERKKKATVKVWRGQVPPLHLVVALGEPCRSSASCCSTSCSTASCCSTSCSTASCCNTSYGYLQLCFL